MQHSQCEIYAITDSSLSLGRSTVEVVKGMLGAGIKILQYREKHKASGVMLEECLAIRAMTREAGCFFIVNDHVDIAMLCKADGIHVGQDDLPVAAVRQLMGKDTVVGVSASSLAEAKQAVADGADYLGVGAIFPTSTKKDASLTGLELLTTIIATCPLPVAAIGGIKESTLPAVVQANPNWVCMVSAITSAVNIPQKIEEMRVLIQSAKNPAR